MNYRANESRDKAVGELVEPCFDYAEREGGNTRRG